MLHVTNRPTATDDFEQVPAQFSGNIYLELERIFAAVRRQFWIVLLIAFLGAIAGVIYILSQTPAYTASTLVLIDNRRVKAVDSGYEAPQSLDFASSLVDSQVEVVRAARITETVIRKLDLLENRKETKSSWFSLAAVRAWIGGLLQYLSPGQTEDAAKARGEAELKMSRAIEETQKSLDVRRVGRTMVLEISYTAESPTDAAVLANAYAEAYLADQLNAKFEATKRASDWLAERLAELKEKALNADLAVQKFRAENGLILSSGKLVNEQQLSELNTQLVIARGERARAEARYERLKAIIQAHETQAVISEAIGNTIIEQLRSKYLDVSKREAELAAKLGPTHQTVVNFRAEMVEYERQMFSELGRLAESYKSEVNIARAKESSLSANLEKLVAVSARENKALVNLRELEREGEAYRSLYQSYLQRYQESLQQQSFPIIEARIITSASPPLKPSSPKKGVTLIMFVFLGAALGSLAGALREYREKGFRREEQIKEDLGIESLGIVPLIKPKEAAAAAGSKEKEAGAAAWVRPAKGGGQDEPAKDFTLAPGIMTYVLDQPMSAFAETLLAVKLALDIKLSGTSSKVIGVVSALPSEGKSVFSKNFASLLAKLNAKTLLIDADLRASGLTRRLSPGVSGGLVEAVIGARDFNKSLLTEHRSGLCFLPTVNNTRIAHTSELLASQGMRQVLAEAEQRFEYVVLDLPPVGPIVDVRAIAPQIHAFVLIVEWRKTARRVVRNILNSDEAIRRKCLGAVMTKVDVSKMQIHEEIGSRYYYFKSYRKSYYVDA